MILRFLARFRFRHVGFVEGRRTYVGSDGQPLGVEDRCYWNLSENGFGFRRAKRFGRKLLSPHALLAAASVDAWLNGGALPDGVDMAGAYEPTPPRKPRAKLTVVPFRKSEQ